MKYNLAEDAAAMQISHDIVALVMRAQSPQHQSLGKMCSAKSGFAFQLNDSHVV